MKLIRTAKFVINASVEEILPTLDAYTTAYNSICQVGWRDKDTNGVSLHHKTYQENRKTLPSQLAISARMKATESLKSVTTRLKKKQKVNCPKSKQTAIRLDKNSYSLWLDSNIASILTIGGRKKFPIYVPEYFKQYTTWKWTSADLFVRNNKILLNVVFEKEFEDVPKSDYFVGVDRGINKIAVTSDNKFFDGKEIKTISHRYSELRSSLQSKQHSGKRHLKKISSKERRFRQNVNHCVSKKIVESIPEGNTLILEKLTGIRQHVRMRKKQRTELHKWNFFQFEQFLAYKAMRKGIGVEYVPARYTSQKCSRCGNIDRSNRQSQSVFVCTQCGFSLNADLNASRNIRANYLDAIGYPSRVAVNQPSGCSRSIAVEQAQPSLVVG